MNFKGTDCIIHVPQRLPGMDERVQNSCKQRAEYLRHSFIIVHTEHGQGQAFWCNGADLISEFPEILGGGGLSVPGATLSLFVA